jgi:hypothetical protein
MPFGFLRSIVNIVAPKPLQQPEGLTERLINGEVIEAINECGEKRYIEIHTPTLYERRQNLEILLTKCKNLLSSIKLTDRIDSKYVRVVALVGKIRESMYMNMDITDLVCEFEALEKEIKRASSSFRNLSDAVVNPY